MHIISESYSKKIDSCLNAITYFGSDLKTTLEKYKSQNFVDSNIHKRDLFYSIFKKKLSESQLDFINAKCQSLKHFMDKRMPHEYAIDLALGWIFEDCILNFLNQRGVKSFLSGNDRYREFLTAKKISTQPDIVFISSNENIISLEIFCDWKDTWFSQNHADLRDNKFNRLVEKNSYLLGVSPSQSLGFLMNVKEQKDSFEFKKIYGYGGKFGFTHKNIKSELRPLEEIAMKLINL